jgi:hypothetical protein
LLGGASRRAGEVASGWTSAAMRAKAVISMAIWRHRNPPLLGACLPEGPDTAVMQNVPDRSPRLRAIWLVPLARVRRTTVHLQTQRRTGHGPSSGQGPSVTGGTLTFP